MCRDDRKIARRGRSVSPLMRLRTYLRRRRRAWLLSNLCDTVASSGALAGLDVDVLADVAHALALVAVGLAQIADVGGHLAHGALVDAGDRDLVVLVDADGDALRDRELDRVRVAEVQDQLLAADL